MIVSSYVPTPTIFTRTTLPSTSALSSIRAGDCAAPPAARAHAHYPVKPGTTITRAAVGTSCGVRQTAVFLVAFDHVLTQIIFMGTKWWSWMGKWCLNSRIFAIVATTAAKSARLLAVCLAVLWTSPLLDTNVFVTDMWAAGIRAGFRHSR